MDIAFEFDDAHEFAAVLATAPTMIRDELVAATDRITITGEGFAKANLTANGSVVTGTLRRSVTHEPATFAGGVATGRYGTNIPYGPPVEFGRRGFSAPPRHALGPMRIGGKMIFRHSVGPAKARPFIRPSVERLRPLVPLEYGAALQRVVNRIRQAMG